MDLIDNSVRSHTLMYPIQMSYRFCTIENQNLKMMRGERTTTQQSRAGVTKSMQRPVVKNNPKFVAARVGDLVVVFCLSGLCERRHIDEMTQIQQDLLYYNTTLDAVVAKKRVKTWCYTWRGRLGGQNQADQV